MKHLYILPIFCLTTLNTIARQNTPERPLEEVFEIRVDTIERKIIQYNERVQSWYFIKISIQNLTDDTVEYISNSCHTYNRYSMKANGMEFFVNEEGGCILNDREFFDIPPDQSISLREPIYSKKLDSLRTGGQKVTMSIPLIRHSSTSFQVGGRIFRKNVEYLVSTGTTIVKETHHDERTPLRKRRESRKKRRL